MRVGWSTMPTPERQSLRRSLTAAERVHARAGTSPVITDPCLFIPSAFRLLNIHARSSEYLHSTVCRSPSANHGYASSAMTSNVSRVSLGVVNSMVCRAETVSNRRRKLAVFFISLPHLQWPNIGGTRSRQETSMFCSFA